MAIIYINGEPIEVDETAQNNNGSSECPPGSIQTTEIIIPNAGDAIFAEYNFSDVSFLAPTREIDLSNHSTTNVREINILNEFHYYRNYNFTINEEAEQQPWNLFQENNLHTNSEFSLVSKQLFVSDNSRVRNNRFETPEIDSGQSDKFRIANNALWALLGTEEQPKQEFFILQRVPQTRKDYDVRFLRQGPNEKIIIDFLNSDFSNTNSLPEDTEERRTYMSDKLSRIFTEGKYYEDFCTSIPQPLLRSEFDTSTSSERSAHELAETYIIDFDVTTTNFSADPNINIRPEDTLKSLYREHYRTVENPGFSDDCNLQRDRVQKFIAGNYPLMKSAHSNSNLLSQLGNYVTIDIIRPYGTTVGEVDWQSGLATTETPNLLSLKFSEQFASTQHDKYFLELATARETASNTSTGEMHQKGFIIITDESDTVNEGYNPISRINDKFSTGFISQYQNTIEYFLHQWPSPNATSYRFSGVLDSIQEYPLKFAGFESQERLASLEVQAIPQFTQAFEAIATSQQRSYENIFRGRKAKSVIIGYKIEKRRVSPDGLIQTFYVMEPGISKSEIVEPLRFIDSQVHYGRAYKYRIYAITMTFASFYKYTIQNEAIFPDVGQAEVDVTTQIIDYGNGLLPYNTRLSEIPFFEKIVSIADLPPLPPEVTFLPDKKNPSILKIALNHNVGSRKEDPIIMKPDDNVIVTKMLNSQQDTAQGLLYYSDTIPEQYEIFMTRIPPRDYSSFGPFMTLETNSRLTVFAQDINVNFNEDMYFTFRSIEAAGISNPTPVYKFRMVSSPNGNYMVLEEFDMKELIDPQANLTFEKNLKICPSTIQKSIRYGEGIDISSRDFSLSAPSLDSIYIGPEQDSIWGKNYKFRITSKKTGRKIDLNATFDKAKINNDRTYRFGPDDCSSNRISTACLELGGQMMPKVNAVVQVTYNHTCELIPERSVSAVESEDYQLDLNNLDGNGTNLLDFAKSSSSTYIYYFKDDETSIVTSEEKSFKDFCMCDEDPNSFSNLFPLEVVLQKDKAQLNQDYIAIFDTEGDIPKHMQLAWQGLDQEWIDENAEGKIRTEQTLWWTTPTTEHYEQAQLNDMIVGDTAEAIWPDTFWPKTRELATIENENNIQLSVMIYEDNPAGPCLDLLKRMVTDLVTQTYSFDEVSRLKTEFPGETPPGFSPAVWEAASSAHSRLESQLPELESQCPQIPDDYQMPTLIVNPVRASDDLTFDMEIEEYAPNNEGQFSVKLSKNPSILGDEFNHSVFVAAQLEGAPADVFLSPANIELTKENWNSNSNLFTVTSMRSDRIDIGDRLQDVKFNTSQHPVSELGFNDLIVNRIVKIKEKDTAGITVSRNNTIINEGTSKSVNIKLKSEPNGTVRIGFEDTSAFSGNATISAAFVDLDSTNYSAGEWIEVGAIEESVIDGDVVIQSKFVVISAPDDPNYLDFEHNWKITIADNDTAELAADPSALSIEESSSGTTNISLSHAPASDVQVELTNLADFTSHATVTPSSGIIDIPQASWDTGVDVTFEATDERIVDQDTTIEANFSVVNANTTDSNFHNLTKTVEVQILNDDPAEFDVQRMNMSNGVLNAPGTSPTNLSLVEGSTIALSFSIKGKKIPTGNVVLSAYNKGTNTESVLTLENEYSITTDGTNSNQTGQERTDLLDEDRGTDPMKWTPSSTAFSRWLWFFEALNETAEDGDTVYEFDFKIKQSETTDPVFSAITDVIHTVKVTIKNNDQLICEDAAGNEMDRVETENGAECQCPMSAVYPHMRKQLINGVCVDYTDIACPDVAFEGDLSDVEVTLSQTADNLACKAQFDVKVLFQYTCGNDRDNTLQAMSAYFGKTVTLQRQKILGPITPGQLLNEYVGAEIEIYQFIGKLTGRNTQTQTNVTMGRITNAGSDFYIQTTHGRVEGQDIAEFATLDEFRAHSVCDECQEEITTDNFRLVSAGGNCVCPDNTALAGQLPSVIHRDFILDNQEFAAGTYCNGFIQPRIETHLLLFGMGHPGFESARIRDDEVPRLGNDVPWMLERINKRKILYQGGLGLIELGNQAKWNQSGLTNQTNRRAWIDYAGTWNFIFNQHMNEQNSNAHILTKEMEKFVSCQESPGIHRESDNLNKIAYPTGLPGKKLMLKEEPVVGSPRKHFAPGQLLYGVPDLANYSFWNMTNHPYRDPDTRGDGSRVVAATYREGECQYRHGESINQRWWGLQVFKFASDFGGSSATHIQHYPRYYSASRLSDTNSSTSHSNSAFSHMFEPFFAYEFTGDAIQSPLKSCYGLEVDVYDQYSQLVNTYIMTPFGCLYHHKNFSTIESRRNNLILHNRWLPEAENAAGAEPGRFIPVTNLHHVDDNPSRIHHVKLCPDTLMKILDEFKALPNDT